MQRNKVGRPSFLEYNLDKKLLRTLAKNMQDQANEVIDHLHTNIGKSPQVTRKAVTIEGKINELLSMIEQL
ncbi:hypothetical protein [Methylobacter sp.]|uniref:hypothetical protein n=1 Tax=Methylobacter sp. TaxID=2051955 RepID=UPI003DA67C3B